MKSQSDIHQQFEKMLNHFTHVLPAQASIRDFVHHNTLHGFEHLKFQDALSAANKLTGAYGYWSKEKFREQYLKGRINDSDLDVVLAADESLNANDIITDSLHRNAVYRIALIYPLKKITACQLKWNVEEGHAFSVCQSDISALAKQQLLGSGTGADEASVIRELWETCVEVLGLNDALLHPEQMKELSPQQAERIMQSLLAKEGHENDPVVRLTDEEKQAQEAQQKAWDELSALASDTDSSTNKAASTSRQKSKPVSKLSLRNLIKTLTGVDIDKSVVTHTQSTIDPLIRNESWRNQNALFADVGDKLTLRSLLKQLTNIDIQQEIVPSLQRFIANWLDEGFSAWNSNDKRFYHCWKQSASNDKNWLFDDMPEWQQYIDSLPDNSTDAVIAELTRMDIPKDKWTAYLERLALELPGWSGMFYWRSTHLQYDTLNSENTHKHVEMMDYLAVRLVMEHLFVRRLCGNLWLNEGSLSAIRGYFHRHHAEFSVRYSLYNQHLPEYLIGLSQQLSKKHETHVHTESEWHALAHMIWTRQQTEKLDENLNEKLNEKQGDKQGKSQKKKNQDGWVLFRLAQHLGLNASALRQLNSMQIDQLFDCIDTVADPEKSGFLLLQAYEHHYRETVFNVVAQNHGRGTWANREFARPDAQVIFCMDDREEGFRRHLEHINPAIETLGAAAFFGVVMEWKGLDAKKPVVLCPVVFDPVHEIEEVAATNQQSELKKHRSRYGLRTRLREFIHKETQRNLLSTSVLISLFSPFALATLLGKIFAPFHWGKAVTKAKNDFDTPVTTRVESCCDTDIGSGSSSEASANKPLQHGFSLEEQTNIVAGFLQNNGLLSGFSHFVVTIGHYSRNQNNPHVAAYGCGACGGKFSGPNGRVFAAMANNSDVRTALTERDIHIPDDCWFLGGEHDTCNEAITLEDTDLIPDNLTVAFEKLKADLALAAKHSAHERCRKLASAPRKPNLEQAAQHIAGRAMDFSQARPELGHATIAAGFVGRRHLSQGTFMDRRCFLISYDANVDPEGEFLERILLSAGPVGAGINLEYYFSSVNNEKYGCGSKIVHNLAGLFGVMEGGAGDLRTGLPLQMIEIHEPMRLQLMVEANIDVLTKIYTRQPPIQQLVGNGWLLLSSKDPVSGEIYTFDPDSGWVKWQEEKKQSSSSTTATQNEQQLEQKIVQQSSDWYSGHYDHLSPTLLATVDKPKTNIKEELNHA